MGTTQPPPVQHYPAPSAAQTPRGRGLGVAALVLGIIAVVFSWIPFVNVIGIIGGFVGIALGFVGVFVSHRVMSVVGMGLALLGVIVGFVVTNAAANSISKTLNAPTATAPGPAASGPLTSLGSGTYPVGIAADDVTPGTYRTAGSASSFPCYWAREKDTTGELGSIIANGTPTGPTTVTVKSSDGAFETMGCQTWTKVG